MRENGGGGGVPVESRTPRRNPSWSFSYATSTSHGLNRNCFRYFEEDEVPHTEPLEEPQPGQVHVAFDGTPPNEVPQPMEVEGQVEGGSTLENQAVEEETQASNMAKKRRIVQDTDEQPRCNDLELEHVKLVNKVRLPWSQTLYGNFTGEDQEPDFFQLAEDQEREEKRRREAQAYTIINLVLEEHLLEQIGKNIYFDLVDLDKVGSCRLKNQMPFSAFKEDIAKGYGVPVQCQRFWTWAKRQNHTYRLDRPLTREEETRTFGQLMAFCKKNDNGVAVLNLFMETKNEPDPHSLPLPSKSEEDILVFLKLYDPEKAQLRYVGSLLVRSCQRPTEIISKLNEKAVFSPDEEIELYEEIKFERCHELESEPCVMCQRLDKETSFESSQKSSSQAHQYQYPDVPSFMKYVKYRQVVRFRKLDRPQENDFSLELSKLHTYANLAAKVAQRLDLKDSSKISFTPHDCFFKGPHPFPIKYQTEDRLIDMLNLGRFYQVVFYHGTATKEKPIIHNTTLLKKNTVGDVLTEIKEKVFLPKAQLRLLQLRSHTIYEVFKRTDKIEHIKSEGDWTLRAEEDEIRKVDNFGEPFLLVVGENETLASVKVRIQHKLEVPSEEFSKWKFAFVFVGYTRYLPDSCILSRLFGEERNGVWDNRYLGLEHA
ncbi:hypothetical protein L2E82_33151 [Cichorium intybus]|uniref:Uncharacterized protein n=1 Tax=Cichorium intybus TaxID=13427 RepID=A0ACB9BJL6_CICIN|nr:hypothetical protein L2E82_33151 [Cichorium intybus]